MRPTHLEKTFEAHESQLGMTFSSVYKERILELSVFYKLILHDLFESKAPNHMMSEVACFLHFLEGGAKIYKLCENFGKDLFRANLDVPVKLIPETHEVVCIEFPDSIQLRHSDNSLVRCVYIRQDEFYENGAAYRGLRLQFPDYDDNDELIQTSSYININIMDKEKKLSQLLKECPYHIEDFCLNFDAINLAVKAYLYLHSGEPDLRFERHIEYPITKKEKKRRHFLRENKGKLVDLTLLGYEHKKGKLYNIDSFEVSGHFRWQRYGIALMNVRLIWIDGFTKCPKKTYKNLCKKI